MNIFPYVRLRSHSQSHPTSRVTASHLLEDCLKLLQPWINIGHLSGSFSFVAMECYEHGWFGMFSDGLDPTTGEITGLSRENNGLIRVYNGI